MGDVSEAVDGERWIRSHPAVRTLLLTRGELSAWLLDERTESTQQLNTSAAAVWALLEEPITVEGLVRDLAETFEIDAETASETVTLAVDSLHEADLIVEEHPSGDGRPVEEHPSADEPSGDERSGDAAGESDTAVPALTRAPDP
ncbi:MAG: PqqD family protein [Ilumatobacteraceae bacterium]